MKHALERAILMTTYKRRFHTWEYIHNIVPCSSSHNVYVVVTEKVDRPHSQRHRTQQSPNGGRGTTAATMDGLGLASSSFG